MSIREGDFPPSFGDLDVTKAVLKRTQISRVSVFVIDWKAE